MSRRARARADARPWLQQRDGDHFAEAGEMVDDDTDEHLRERAWEQREIERQQPQGETR